MALNSVNSEQVLEIIESACKDSGITVPPDLRADFHQHLSNLPKIDSFLKMRQQLCLRIKKVLDLNEELGEKYGALVTTIRDKVRLKIGLLLGFEESVTKVSKSGNDPAREVLTQFITGLPAGDSWSPAMLKRWSSWGENGADFYTRIYYQVGWSEDSIKVILGEKAEALLQRNPFEKKVKRLNTVRDVRKYLVEFLKKRSPPRRWSVEDLKAWESSDGVTGEALYTWIFTHYDDFNTRSVKKIVGNQDKEFLKNSPFRPVSDIRSRGDARRVLLKYLATLTEGSAWSPDSVKKWKNSNGSGGIALYNWLNGHMNGGFDGDAVAKILGEEKEKFLAKHPFEYREPKLKSRRDARKYMGEFLRSRRGKIWSPQDFIDWDGGSVSGQTFYKWLCRNMKKDGKLNWNYILEKLADPAVLRTNPFRFQFRRSPKRSLST